MSFKIWLCLLGTLLVVNSLKLSSLTAAEAPLLLLLLRPSLLLLLHSPGGASCQSLLTRWCGWTCSQR